MRNFGCAYERFSCSERTANALPLPVEMLSASFVIPTGVFVHCLPLLVFSIFQRERERTDWARCPAACESANRKPLAFIASPGTLQRGPWREERERAGGRERATLVSARHLLLLLATSFVPALLPNNKTGSEFCLPPLVCFVSCLHCPGSLRRWPPGGVNARGSSSF